MPVGGIKEKVIAAHRAGVERIILPRRNEKDLREVPDEVKQQLKFDFVDTVQDVLKVALNLDVSPGSGSDLASGALVQKHLVSSGLQSPGTPN